MKHTVTWGPTSEKELAALWINAADRTDVTRAAYTLDQRLAADPEGLSESREFDERIMIEAPLAIRFEIDHQSHRVLVLHVWHFAKRKKNP